MFSNNSRRLHICVMLMALWSSIAGAVDDRRHPLEPLDLSSPRATLNSFLVTGDDYLRLLSDEYWVTPSRANVARLHEMGARAEGTLDLSETPPAARFDMGRDEVVYLYEVLSRIELPPKAEIPDATFYADAGDDKKAGGKPVRWTIPHTEITIARVTEGPRAGEFLFSPSTVARAEEFYQKSRTLPYRRDVPLKDYAEKRVYLSMASWLIPPRTIDGFPEWLKRGVYEQAVWKWFALAGLIPLTIVLFILIHRLARCGTRRQSITSHLCRLVTPLTLLLLTPLVLDIANRELTLTGWVAEYLTLMADAVGYFALAWLAWTGSIVFAELVIVSPKIPEQSLNAHLLRLAARVVGGVAVITIIFYVSSQLGAPLYGIVAGVSIDELFLSGVAPGLLLMLMLGIFSLYVGRKTAVPRHAFSWSNLAVALREGIWDVMLPLGVIIGIFGGYLTISEASACTAVYVLVLESLIHREIDLRRYLFPLLKDTSILVGSILIILSVAMGLTNLLIDAQVPMKLFGWVKVHIDSQLQFLMLLNVFLLVVGCMMDIFSAIVVVVPLILPIAKLYGIDPVHLGIIFLANLEIGYSTPPVGINLFIACSRFDKPVLTLYWSAVPFLLLMLVGLAFITYVPDLSLWLVRTVTG